MTDFSYPKRLIEVDLPIKKISEHARREKSIRHGHISTLHIWWARRPLAACRAVICAALWPDPADPLCPEPFRIEVRKQMTQFWNQMDASARNVDDLISLRTALLDFIADFANWDNSTDERYLNTARALTQSAHEALGGKPGTRPLVVDPFAGGGSIPLEALRVGADAYASDLNPVAVLLNKVVLEYIPKYRQTLADEVRKWGQWVKAEAEKELAEYYPKDPDGATPIAYLWARTITCEGPGCGAEVPLIRSLWLAKKKNRSVALRLIPNPAEKRVEFAIIQDPKVSDVKEGTVKRGSATCPCCGYTTPVVSVRRQLKARHGGADDARMFCVVTTKHGQQGRFYRLPTKQDLIATRKANEELEQRKKNWTGDLSLVPNEENNEAQMFNNSTPLYGMTTWAELFSPRQLLAITVLMQNIQKLENKRQDEQATVIKTCLAFVLDRQIDKLSSLSRWDSSRENPQGTFGRQAFPMVWDFDEVNPFSGSGGDWQTGLEWVIGVIENGVKSSRIFNTYCGRAKLASATNIPLSDDTVQAFITDPPYYYSVQYAGLSDFFYVWLKRTLYGEHTDLFARSLTSKSEEIVVSSPTQANAPTGKNIPFYITHMTSALLDGRRITNPYGISVIVFAQLQTAAWESFLQSVIDAGWIITGSWPIDTEMSSRMLASRQSVLGSSIHLVCRPRENPDGNIRTNDVGDWRDVLHELPVRIHEWMPRLAAEGVVGADAIFACLGPALEIYSRYSRVEKPNGEQVLLREYLEKVWEAVAREALTVIFHDADTSGFEEDARLTAMWLWTLSSGGDQNGATNGSGGEVEEADDEEKSATKKTGAKGGFTLEYDAARKIAQGLGAHPEEMRTLVEVKGDTARLLPVSERAQFLFGKQGAVKTPVVAKRKGKQMTLGEMTGENSSEAVTEAKASMEVQYDLALGKTVLDSVHQSMLLFGAGRSDALKIFLVDNGVGKDPRFWRLAQALSALYPKSSEEKRWVDGVLARKKGLGL
jgi:putative DNA methylase